MQPSAIIFIVPIHCDHPRQTPRSKAKRPVPVLHQFERRIRFAPVARWPLPADPGTTGKSEGALPAILISALAVSAWRSVRDRLRRRAARIHGSLFPGGIDGAGFGQHEPEHPATAHRMAQNRSAPARWTRSIPGDGECSTSQRNRTTTGARIVFSVKRM